MTTRLELARTPTSERLWRGLRPESLNMLRTSGSTGTPLTTQNMWRDRWLRRLVELRSLRRIGFRPGDSMISVGPRSPRPLRLHHRLGLYRTQVISGWNPIDDTLQQLRRSRPTFLWIYPTVVRAVWAAGERLSDYAQPRSVIVAAECMDPPFLSRIRADLGLTPYNFYGCIELGRLAAECPARKGLHVNTDHVTMEICDRNGKTVPPGTAGEVVLTGLNGYAMPFLRYRIGDVAAWSEEGCPCGSPLPLIRPPLGRVQETIRLPGGSQHPVWRFHRVLHQPESLLHYRIIQDRIDHLIFQLVTTHVWSQQKTERFREALLQSMGQPIGIEIQFNERLEDDRLKVRTFISRLEESPDK